MRNKYLLTFIGWLIFCAVWEIKAAGLSVDWFDAPPSNEVLYCAGLGQQDQWVDRIFGDTLFIDRNCTGREDGFCKSEFIMDPEVLTGVGVMHVLKAKDDPSCFAKGDHICSAKIGEAGTMILECLKARPIEYQRIF